MTAKPSKSDIQTLASAVSQLSTAIKYNSSLLEKNTKATEDAAKETTTPANSEEIVKEQKEARKDGNERGKSIIKQLDSMARTLNRYGAAMERLSSTFVKTQQEFGVSISSAAKLQTDAMISSFESAIEALGSVSAQGAEGLVNALASGVKEIGTGLLPGEDFGKSFIAGVRTIGNELNKPQPGPPLKPFVTRTEYLGAAKDFQNEFGVINTTISNKLAEYSKQYGVNVQQLVQSRRTFLTIARGDLSKVESIQTRFFDEFSRRGMTPKVALEAITKYADLIARNGTRFADSFARAAADAKKIGVDLAKVDQFGDNIIDNFEGFLESQAELGAMGFGFDSSRLAEIAATGDTGALYKELRSQLSMMGKDINNLTRPDRLALEGMGIDIATMQRMAGGTPEIAPEKLQEQSNSMLGSILTIMQVSGPLMQALASISSAISSGMKLLTSAIQGLSSLIGGIGVTNTVIGTLGIILSILQAVYANWLDKKKQAAAEDIKTGISTQNLDLVKQGQNTRARIEILENNIGARDFNELNVNRQLNKKLEQLKAKEKAEEREFILNMTSEGAPLVSPLPTSSPLLKQLAPVPGTQFGLPQNTEGPSLQQQYLQPQKKASGGPIKGPGTGTSDSIPAMLSNGEYVLPAALVSRIGVKNLDKLRSTAASSNNVSTEDLLRTVMNRSATAFSATQDSIHAAAEAYVRHIENPNNVQRKKDGGLIGKLKSSAMNKGMDFLSNRFPSLSGTLDAVKTGGIKGGLMNRGMQLLSNRIPGLSGAMDAFSAFKTGGIKGAIGSLAKGGIGKMIGGAIGSAIPIPGVGTAIGSLMGSKVGKLVGGLFGRRKKPIAQQIMGALPEMSGFAGNLMGRIPGMERFNPEGMFRGMANSQQAQTAVQAVVDTTGIEQKLNNFITALNSMNIVMDGAKVGKVLVNVSDAANTLGVFKPTSRATL